MNSKHGRNCIEWSGAKKSSGYGHVTINKKQLMVHRLAYRLFLGQIPNDKLVCHSCDNKLCINPSHLFLGSHKDNSQDASKKGLLSFGSRRYNAKFDESVALKIKTSNKKSRFLAEKYGVCLQTIRNIKAGRRWRHV